MQIEQRIQVLEDEFADLKEDLKGIMLDIRSYLMEAHSPLRNSPDSEENPS